MKADINRIKNHPRYNKFAFFESPVWFEEYFKDKDYSIVQLYDIRPISEHIPDPIGFVGKFKWKSNKLTPLDGDSYTEHMPIYGYHEFEHDGQTFVSVLTDEW